ncbi:MAG TPA: alpha-glucosidase [Clostridiaceae bacterium]|nr:alpha-glucosidase [Clostridiaceae bacterium]
MEDFKNRIVYQIWPRSFKDSDGDGIGDLRGILTKLDYLKDLGIDTIWLSPIYATGNKDYGYDVDDYYRINPEFGTMADFDLLLEEAKKRGIGIVMDLVANHTSDQHNWFRYALEHEESPYRDFYFFRKGRLDKEGFQIPPNDWLSAFGGSAWQKDDRSGEYYLTMFTPNQCDLNWENESVRKGFYDIMRFWLDKGIQGFRMDVINTISKAEGLPNAKDGHGLEFPFEHIVSLPKTHDYLKEMHEEVLSHYPGTFTVGEGLLTTPEDLIHYTNPREKELDMMFQFDIHLIGCGPLGKYDFRKLYYWRPVDLKRIINNWQLKVQKGNGWLGNFMSNHDQPRQVSRFGDDLRYRRISTKSLAILNMTLRGTPFLYQGEEIGMTNCPLEVEEWRDYEAINAHKVLQEMMNLPEPLARKVIKKMTRDHSRTPMQWSHDPYAGFSTTLPWMKVNPNYKWLNVESELHKKDSLIAFYKELIALRKGSPALNQGTFLPVDRANRQVIAYLRDYNKERILVIVNLGEKQTHVNLEVFKDRTLTYLLGNYATRTYEKHLQVSPYEAMIFKVE